MNKARYSRQMLFPPIGDKGQQQLANSRVLIVGAGALGTVAANHMVRAGIGWVRIVDRDFVELSNLQRQMLYDEEDVKQTLPKAIAAKNKLEQMNSTVKIEAFVNHVSSENIMTLIKDMDVVIDGTDNFATRHLLNDACFKVGIPFSYGGVVSSRGMTAFFRPGVTCCLRCRIKEGAQTGETCDTAGVISPVVDMVASQQSTDVLKYLTGHDEQIDQTLRTFDLWYNQHFAFKFSKPDDHCPTCQQKQYPALNSDQLTKETALCGRDTVQIHHHRKMDLADWESRLKDVADVQRTPFLLKAHFATGLSFAIFPDGRVLVQGTEDVGRARSMYDRYIGS
ncbi:Sulfur carrier protein ThiS adenylyltransferase [Lentibacillus sp. JNUCC-1]|uniref:ThiF family adenylyltransferase n=1 Tax=Lentibacillus sp. JNUCC-1 TaxID=2654513 RepID=UPI0012E86650|nr:ThiF family adenylyltransferase [Lentibacillus sp. JNUCC-1]MUV39634.1 Sulfur carrier protein ThiS adenylyltransferase [Lentibacillus sp. JNUCC-1]